MKHRVQNSRLGTDTKHTKAIIKGLVLSLITHGSIETTVTKAKEASRVADKLIGKARVDSLTVRRTLHMFFGKRDAVNTLVDRIAPVFATRTSGFTRVVKIGTRRGDNTAMARVSLVEQPTTVGSLKKPQTAVASDAVNAPKKAAAKKAVATPAPKTEAQTETKPAVKTAKKPAAKKASKVAAK